MIAVWIFCSCVVYFDSVKPAIQREIAVRATSPFNCHTCDVVVIIFFSMNTFSAIIEIDFENIFCTIRVFFSLFIYDVLFIRIFINKLNLKVVVL